jgi:hypothetical protein
VICRQCNADYSPLLPGCPHCYQKNGANRFPNSGTRRLPDLSGAPTRHLVALNSCPSCRFLLFPTDVTCPSCGMNVRNGTEIQNTGVPRYPANTGDTKRKAVIGVAIGSMALAFVLILVILVRYI